ncbi:uncharacterized protein HMPREF1541_01828 [Cyphellophora europaea CBS 101466]|uniref:RecA family profile 1 domain-containing protein n=1 Tax=Cyphellophora europaea (strain CBS 101466) TaxID=1220924 RepID=W2S1S1_CYPE1|nr:uncharacterized protein HMPREF1541_01828 [Cyphellophora europaea CBS 101466]ETN42671.1 hypothetical protein HMPREF1541_01828 [Cyphellophora europaea CBS 101466]
MPQDEPDIHNFSTSSEHRLPAISGAQALQDELQRARGVPTSLPSLDRRLNQRNSAIPCDGIRCGHVTEVYGPPGSGKTTFGAQVSVNALHAMEPDAKAVWIAAGSPLMQTRFDDLTAAYIHRGGQELPSSPPQPPNQEGKRVDNFSYKEVRSLPHLLAMLMHPTTLFPPPHTKILVIDGLPNILQSAFPRRLRQENGTNTILQENAAKKAAGRRFQLIENLASALSRLAAARHIAIVILTNTITSVKGGQRAILKPALSGHAWDAAIHTRILLYRDLYPQEHKAKLNLQEKRSYRIAEVVRLGAKDILSDPVPFVIETGGLRELDIYTQLPEAAAPPVPREAEEDMLLQIRTSQPDRLPAPPIDPEAILPTASQLLRDATTTAGASPLPVPLPANIVDPVLDDSSSSQTGPKKRKAVEIADSEDEDEDETAPSAGTVPQEQNAAAENDTTEEMLFDEHGRHNRTT